MTQPFDEKADLAKWQRRLLPWAAGLLFALALFFFVSSWIQFDRLSAAMQNSSEDQISETFRAFEAKQSGQDLAYLKWKTAVLLERNTVNHRYRQVNATLLLRTWTRHLGFLTGMILAFIGGIFILTKLSESETRLGAESSAIKGSLATSSPGIVLTVVGATIMIVTLVIDHRFSTVDTPAYIGPADAPPSSAPQEAEGPLPLLEDEQARQAEENYLVNNAGAPDP